MMDDFPSIPETSPSPSTSPVPALGACPDLERSVSTASSASTFSLPSTASRASDIGGRANNNNNRRGYLRPQGTNFSDSARNRESVMSLGSIAHLQYYFARTGLLEGKGGQLFKGKAKPANRSRPGHAREQDKDSLGLSLAPLNLAGRDSTYSSMRSSPDPMVFGDQVCTGAGGRAEYPIEGEPEQGESEGWAKDEEPEPLMLPPTVSTYNYPTKHVPPPPRIDELRTQLRDSLKQASKLLQDVARDVATGSDSTPKTQADDGSVQTNSEEMQGWHEIQGMHILDIVTLAIRAAKLYYTAHEHPSKLNAIRPERKIREELLTVLDALKKMALRNFAGGVRADEQHALHAWVSGVENLVQEEEDRERAEVAERETWHWMHGDWSGPECERERAWSFLRSFDPSPDTLPGWTATDSHSEVLPTPFLQTMQTGLRLIHLHNAMVRKSTRVFELITSFHTDTRKPYRCADNLRYWIKAAELRWEISLKVDVLGVVAGQSQDAWRGFEGEILRWCTRVREELAAELEAKAKTRRRGIEWG